MAAQPFGLNTLAVLLLALVQTAQAYDVPPFTWKALEEAERHASTVAASLYAESVHAVRNRVLTPETPSGQSCRQNVETITPQSAPPNAVILSLSLLATITAFLLGWYGGIKQAEASQALQQAKTADQAEIDTSELEEAAKLAVTSVTTPSISPAEGQQASAPMPGVHLQNNMPVTADCTAPHQWSSPSDSDKDEDNMQAEASCQESVSSQGSVDNAKDSLQEESVVAAGQNQQGPAPTASGLDMQHSTAGEPSSDMPSTSQHSGPVAQQQQLFTPQQVPAQSSTHTSASHQQPALTTLQRPNRQPPLSPGTGMRSSSAHSEEAAALNTASTIVEVFAQRLGIDPQQLDQQQRLSYLSSNVAALGVYLNFLNHKENHRLQGISNDQGAQHNDILREGQGETRAWRQAKEGQKQLQLFFERLADCLMCGLMLMMAGMLYWGVTLGYYQGRLSECSGRHPGYLLKVWKPWHAVESLQTLWCQGAAFADLIVCFVVMLFTVWAVKRHQLLSNSIAQPMTGLVLGLGAAGGTAGWFAISKVGGDAMVWLYAYWSWVLSYVLCVLLVQDVHNCLTQKAAGGFCKQFIAFVKLPLFYASMGFMHPLAVAACPFWKLIRGSR